VCLRGVSNHCPGYSALADHDEPVRFVQGARRILTGDTETDRLVSLSNAGRDELGKESSSDPLVPATGNDCYRQFGNVFGDEPMAMDRLGERPIPRRTNGSVVLGNQSVVAGPRPTGQVHRVTRIGERLVAGRCRLVGAPDRGFAEHRREKAEVFGRCRANSNVVHMD